MSVPDFLDTNVFVYAYDPGDIRKQKVAQQLLDKAVAGEFVTSAQVLGEFAATLLHKLTPPVPPGDLVEILDALEPIRLVAIDGGTIRRAVEARAAYGVHFYDALILAAAERGQCARLWSEDLSAGQSYFRVRVENPFR